MGADAIQGRKILHDIYTTDDGFPNLQQNIKNYNQADKAKPLQERLDEFVKPLFKDNESTQVECVVAFLKYKDEKTQKEISEGKDPSAVVDHLKKLFDKIDMGKFQKDNKQVREAEKLRLENKQAEKLQATLDNLDPSKNVATDQPKDTSVENTEKTTDTTKEDVENTEVNDQEKTTTKDSIEVVDEEEEADKNQTSLKTDEKDPSKEVISNDVKEGEIDKKDLVETPDEQNKEVKSLKEEAVSDTTGKVDEKTNDQVDGTDVNGQVKELEQAPEEQKKEVVKSLKEQNTTDGEINETVADQEVDENHVTGKNTDQVETPTDQIDNEDEKWLLGLDKEDQQPPVVDDKTKVPEKPTVGPKADEKSKNKGFWSVLASPFVAIWNCFKGCFGWLFKKSSDQDVKNPEEEVKKDEVKPDQPQVKKIDDPQVNDEQVVSSPVEGQA